MHGSVKQGSLAPAFPPAPALSEVMPARIRRWQLNEDTATTALLFVAMAAFACVTPAQNDTWWHLRSGQEMWQSGSFLFTERFSHTAQGATLHNHWWVSQLLFLAVYRIGGAVLLTLFAGACAAAAVVASWKLLRRGSAETSFVALAVLLVTTAPEWSVRPQVISMVMLVICLHLVHRDRIGWLPLVCVVWANAHAMVVFGVVVAAAVALESLLWSRDRLRRDVAMLGLCVVSPMLSPLGWHYWPRVLGTVSTSKELGLQEYRAPFEGSDFPFWLLGAGLVILTVMNRHRIRDLRRSERITLLVAAVLGVAALSAARNVAFFALAAVPAAAGLWHQRAAASETKRARRAARTAPWPAYVLLLLVVAGAGTFVMARWRNGGAALGWRPMSPGAIEAVRVCPGRLFNQMDDGGYLMWALPERLVFVDSRMEAYPRDFLRRVRDAELEADYSDLFRQYNVNCALVRADSKLGAALEGNETFVARYRDPRHLLFARAKRIVRVGRDR